MTQPPIPAITMPVRTFRAWRVPGAGTWKSQMPTPALIARLSWAMARRPHHAAAQRQPEAAPAEHQVVAACQQGRPGEGDVADGHVQDAGAFRYAGQ
jgi:hypothetical protein